MGVNLELAINNMYALKNNSIRYSMTGSRTGADGTGDCSGTIYDSLCKAGASNAGWILNTDSMHAWLVKNDFELIAINREWLMKRGDIVILGKKGASSGAAGHVFMALDHTNAIHCTWKSVTKNGIFVENEAKMPYFMGWYVYRLKKQVSNPENSSKGAKFQKGQAVRLMDYATHYQTGEPIASFAKNKRYQIIQIKPVNNAGSKYAYLLSGIVSWVLEQDLNS